MNIQIANKRDTKNGEYFDLIINGVTVTGCQYKSGTNSNGEYEFLAMPSRLGKDKEGKDKWYAVVKLDDETAKAALDEYKGETEPPF